MSLHTRELTPDDAPAVIRIFDTFEWWEGRDEDDLATALERTDVAIGVEEDGELIAAARVLTDGVYYAKIYDVVVHADYRGRGVGRELMEAIDSHPGLQDVYVALDCREGLVPFYEACGLEPHDMTYEHDGEDEPVQVMYYPRE